MICSRDIAQYEIQCHQVSRCPSFNCAWLNEVAAVAYISYEHVLRVIASATDLKQEIGATAGPSHLLGFVHAAVDQEVGGAFGERCADPQTSPMALGIIDQPGALAGQITVDLAQRCPEPA
jgi:hypothetical protein